MVDQPYCLKHPTIPALVYSKVPGKIETKCVWCIEEEARQTMSDKDTLKAMLEKAGIVYSEDDKGQILVENGYVGFYAVFSFKVDDSLEEIGAYE